MHGCAEAACVDVFLTDARENQLIAVGAYQVEAHPAFAWCHEPPVDQVALMSRGGEGVDEIGTDFVAADADCGADRDDKVGRLAAKLPLHFLDGRYANARRRSAPAGMYGCDCTGPHVGDEQRGAVGGAHHERNVGRVRDNCIRLRTLAMHGFKRLMGGVPVDADDVPTVDLIQRHDAAGWNVDGGREHAPRVR